VKSRKGWIQIWCCLRKKKRREEKQSKGNGNRNGRRAKKKKKIKISQRAYATKKMNRGRDQEKGRTDGEGRTVTVWLFNLNPKAANRQKRPNGTEYGFGESERPGGGMDEHTLEKKKQRRG